MCDYVSQDPGRPYIEPAWILYLEDGLITTRSAGWRHSSKRTRSHLLRCVGSHVERQFSTPIVYCADRSISRALKHPLRFSKAPRVLAPTPMGTTTRKRSIVETAEETQAAERPKRGKRQRSVSPPPAAPAPAAKSRHSQAHAAEAKSGRSGTKRRTADRQGEGAGSAKAAAPASPTAAVGKGKRPGRSHAAAPAGAAASAAPFSINRAPVLTLWAAVVAQRQGFSWDEALTFGKEVSGILAQSKGRSLGIYEAKERSEASTGATCAALCRRRGFLDCQAARAAVKQWPMSQFSAHPELPTLEVPAPSAGGGRRAGSRGGGGGGAARGRVWHAPQGGGPWQPLDRGSKQAASRGTQLNLSTAG